MARSPLESACFLTVCATLVFTAYLTEDSDCQAAINELFGKPPANSITFWGHACFYIDIKGYGIVTDPAFGEREFLRWRRVPAPQPTSYDGARLILISHSHPDHLDPNTLRTFPADATVLCPGPAAEMVSELGMRMRVMRPGDSFDYPGGKVIAVTAKHAGSRYGVRSPTDGSALGYVIYTPCLTVYYSGDTNLFEGMDDVGRVHSPDIAILNISGHLHGPDAVEAARRIGAETVIPAHFGAYGHLFLPARELPRDYDELKEGLGETLLLLHLGESLPLDCHHSEE
jgi:L-ascorbate metabolism protein UlaG (beta-lactamase superfamily)